MPLPVAHPALAGFTWRRYVVGLAATPAEVEEAQRLRHEVFVREWQGREHPDGLDRDDFDEQCDHLLLRDQASGVLVGTFRFNSDRRPTRFYTAGEFDLGALAATWRGHTVELGRACLRREWRNNQALIALARGIAWYADTLAVDRFFGCSSVITGDPADAALLIRALAEDGCLLAAMVEPDGGHRLRGLVGALARRGPLDAAARERVDELLPPLLRFYLRAGARVAAEPAWDPEFGCLDFLTVIDWPAADPGFLARYR